MYFQVKFHDQSKSKKTWHYHGTINIQINESVVKVVWFITRQNNPYLLQNSPTLTRFTTGLSFPLENARQILVFLRH